MAQYEMNLRDYWMIVRRRRVIIVVATLAVMALSFWLAKQKVQVFQATSSVRFEQSASLSGLLVEALPYSGADNIETQASFPYRGLHAITFDHLLAPIAHYVRADEVRGGFTACGLELSVLRHHHRDSWTAVGGLAPGANA